ALSFEPFASGKTGQGGGDSLRTFILEAHLLGRAQNSALAAECGYTPIHLHPVQGIRTILCHSSQTRQISGGGTSGLGPYSCKPWQTGICPRASGVSDRQAVYRRTRFANISGRLHRGSHVVWLYQTI